MTPRDPRRSKGMVTRMVTRWIRRANPRGGHAPGTAPPVPGSNRIRTRVLTPPRAFASDSRACGGLSQRGSGGDGNPPAETKPKSQAWRRRCSMVGTLGRRDGAAVDDVLRAGDGGGARRDEKGDEVSYFRRAGRAPDRDAAE